jgi:hypothetical protein
MKIKGLRFEAVSDIQRESLLKVIKESYFHGSTASVV